MNIIYITEIQIAWCAIDTNFILHNTLHLNLTLDNTNYITNSRLSANPFAENYSAKKRKKIPANEIIQL